MSHCVLSVSIFCPFPPRTANRFNPRQEKPQQFVTTAILINDRACPWTWVFYLPSVLFSSSSSILSLSLFNPYLKKSCLYFSFVFLFFFLILLCLCLKVFLSLFICLSLSLSLSLYTVFRSLIYMYKYIYFILQARIQDFTQDFMKYQLTRAKPSPTF